MRLRNRYPARRGLAAVEMAACLPLIMLLLMGTWEIARLVQVYQVVANAAREGARIAAQGQIINLTGAYTQICKTGSTPNVTDTVKNYVAKANINTTGLNVQFTFLDSGGNPVGNPSEPWQGVKGQRFAVTVTLPYSSFRLNSINYFNVSQVQTTVDWVSLKDDPFTVDTNLPGWNPVP
jgi:Flp pilus assembly protein TadG